MGGTHSVIDESTQRILNKNRTCQRIAFVFAGVDCLSGIETYMLIHRILRLELFYAYDRLTFDTISMKCSVEISVTNGFKTMGVYQRAAARNILIIFAAHKKN